MAKRKRLTPARPDYLGDTSPAPEAKSMFPMGVSRSTPPIAQVAGESALQAAVEDLTGEIRSARAEGRLVQALPLDLVDEYHLVRDRLVADGEDMAALIESLRVRGQQTPIEVVELEQGRFGLISGWRRLAALKVLHDESGEDRFATIQALLRKPENASDAYLAMVEENEIRVGLSYYERARIAARAAEEGVYPDEGAALRGLFANISRSKRSKIRSFIAIYHALDEALEFAAAIPERLGLSLSKALKDNPDVADRIRSVLRATPPETQEQEAIILSKALKGQGAKQSLKGGLESKNPQTESFGPIQLALSADGLGLTLSGSGVTADFQERLRAWLRSQA
ncbi:ParB N-terminal domain-containing protein [Aliiroseovarius subalbicans]|uniref:ParB/RepB/Spo0J family partition protein n=1 Tax=Aliiroseovarius subalbicans TaxID=2925840 RepID=UPI001F56A36B|nr:ParB N-terminal domain-containing protein [Aliiroseovarius subalbicans]MCI2401157.1 ParB N-terminal domain-containing protein [Aliiroseovarius subalbicans]